MKTYLSCLGIAACLLGGCTTSVHGQGPPCCDGDGGVDGEGLRVEDDGAGGGVGDEVDGDTTDGGVARADACRDCGEGEGEAEAEGEDAGGGSADGGDPADGPAPDTEGTDAGAPDVSAADAAGPDAEAPDPCAGVTCPLPTRTCVGASLRTFTGGWCVSDSPSEPGFCAYSTVDAPCERGCADGACVPDPCAGVECEPLGDVCDGDAVLRFGPGVCDEGACLYPNEMEVCEFGC